MDCVSSMQPSQPVRLRFWPSGCQPPRGGKASRSSGSPTCGARSRSRRRNSIRGSRRTIAAVTGTSGKTSVAAFTRQIWSALGHCAASIGTIGVVSPSGETYGSLTTPDPVALHRSLDQLAGEGVTHLAIEASSHGLDQYRLDGLRIATTAFTNITRDHLDYHPSFEAYLAAKLRLFEELAAPGGPPSSMSITIMPATSSLPATRADWPIIERRAHRQRAFALSRP